MNNELKQKAIQLTKTKFQEVLTELLNLYNNLPEETVSQATSEAFLYTSIHSTISSLFQSSKVDLIQPLMAIIVPLFNGLKSSVDNCLNTEENIQENYSMN